MAMIDKFIMKYFFCKKPFTTGTALDLKPGDPHYRAYVGPPEDYDLVSAMVFNLLTCAGLRQHHRVLDVGCGSLRVGRLLIPYLNPGNYIGVDPNRWLINDGILNEIGEDLVKIKKPRFSFYPSLAEFKSPLNLDYAVAQSIFSHCSKKLIKNWLVQISHHLSEQGALFATFLVDSEDFRGDGWVYPNCVKYLPTTIETLACESGLNFEMIDWKHPRQVWAVFSKPGYDKSLIGNGQIAWNRFVSNTTESKT
jgi:SAM-dependent methyltransferase